MSSVRLLPIIVEHTIDEQSPLCGHTHDSLMSVRAPGVITIHSSSFPHPVLPFFAQMLVCTDGEALFCATDTIQHTRWPAPVDGSAQIFCLLGLQANAEIIITFEGTTEMGNPFMARQSYLPTEIHWGHSFVPIILPPELGKTHYKVDISKCALNPAASLSYSQGQACVYRVPSPHSSQQLARALCSNPVQRHAGSDCTVSTDRALVVRTLMQRVSRTVVAGACMLQAYWKTRPGILAAARVSVDQLLSGFDSQLVLSSRCL